jgi:hypothetical protein
MFRKLFGHLACLTVGVVLFIALESCRPAKRTAAPNEPVATPAPLMELQRGEVASYKFEVVARDAKCVFTYDGPFKGQLVTDLKPPCDFSRGHTNGVQHIVQKHFGKGGGNYTVILLIGGPVDANRSDRYMKNGCGTETQPISLSPRGVALGDAQPGYTICPIEDLDRPWFGFSARPV